MKSATWLDSVEELRSMKTKKEKNLQKVSDIYRSLWCSFEKDSIFETLR